MSFIIAIDNSEYMHLPKIIRDAVDLDGKNILHIELITDKLPVMNLESQTSHIVEVKNNGRVQLPKALRDTLNLTDGSKLNIEIGTDFIKVMTLGMRI